eukprot:1632124-Pleurochrysis_carterae.AAC.1
MPASACRYTPSGSRIHEFAGRHLPYCSLSSVAWTTWLSVSTVAARAPRCVEDEGGASLERAAKETEPKVAGVGVVLHHVRQRVEVERRRARLVDVAQLATHCAHRCLKRVQIVGVATEPLKQRDGVESCTVVHLAHVGAAGARRDEPLAVVGYVGGDGAAIVGPVGHRPHVLQHVVHGALGGGVVPEVEQPDHHLLLPSRVVGKL